MRSLFIGLAMAVTMALGGCVTDGMTPEEKAMFRDAAVAEVEYRIDQLQELDILNIEVEPEVLILADAACSVVSLGSPFLVIAMNRKTVEANLTRGAEDQEALLTVEEFQANLHAICKIVRKLLKPKSDEPTALAPEVAPAPTARPVVS